MTNEEHRKEAERLMRQVDEHLKRGYSRNLWTSSIFAEAQVHATLALGKESTL